jgi:hypothetical protein
LRLSSAFLIPALLVSVASGAFAGSLDTAPDDYKVKIIGSWWYVSPTGSIEVNGGPISLTKDFGFGNYSTFAGSVDWRFTRRQHILLYISPNSYGGNSTLERDIVFEGTTIKAGATVDASLKVLSIAPGYEFDIIRRDRGHLGIIAQANILNFSADVNASGAVVKPDGITVATYSGSKSSLAVLPVLGPEFRYYFSDSGRVYVNGAIKGMYFFGYGQFITAEADLGVRLSKHLSVQGGYLLGSRTIVHGTSDRMGVSLTQKGPVFGIEARW